MATLLFSFSVQVLDDMATRGKWWMAVATIWFFLLEWWSTGGATILSERVGGLEIRQLERRDLHELPYNWCRHCGVKKSYAAALSTKEYTPGEAGHKPSKAVHHRSPSNFNKSRHSCNLFAETMKHVRISTSTRLLPTPLVTWRSRNRSNTWSELSANWTPMCLR